MRLAVALAVLVSLQAPARADRDRRAAAAHFQEGSALYSQERWAEALVEFEAGYQAYPLRGFLVNIGQCYRKLDRLDEAADAWRRFLATHPSDAKLRDEVTEALGEVAALQPRSAETPPVESAPDPVPNLDAPSQPAPVAAVIAPEVVTAPLIARAPSSGEKKKGRRWVWAVVGVTVASLAAAAVTVGVVEWQSATPRSGSLGLIDGRR